MARLRPAAASVGDSKLSTDPDFVGKVPDALAQVSPLIHVFAAVTLKPRRSGNSFGRLDVAELVGKVTEGRDQTQSRDRGFWFEP